MTSQYPERQNKEWCEKKKAQLLEKTQKTLSKLNNSLKQKVQH